jgi:hypothetical protein
MLGEALRQENHPDCYIVTGDIAESPTIHHLLTGNHDHYRGSIEESRIRFANAQGPNLIWLDQADPVLFDDFALVGKYAWYDGICGDAQRSEVILYDFAGIVEFCELYPGERLWRDEPRTRNPLLTFLRKLARQAADEARPKLEQALRLRKNVIFATHVAPFEGASWHEGKISNWEWLPWFTCQQMGDMLADVAAQHPDQKILVLCGHNHSPGVYQHAPNLVVLTGKARYGAPDLAGILIDPFDGSFCDTVFR